MGRPFKVVLDTQIFLRSLINPLSACGRLFSDWSSAYNLYVADAIVTEILDVLNRPKIRVRFPQITNELVEYVSFIIQHEAIVVALSDEQIEPICRDPKDDVFLACAKVGNVDYLVSEDNDLLVIKQHGQTKIVNVASFLSILETTGSD
jgi:putative PIN family toxin of toxin-antitoxin system